MEGIELISNELNEIQDIVQENLLQCGYSTHLCPPSTETALIHSSVANTAKAKKTCFFTQTERQRHLPTEHDRTLALVHASL